MSWSYLIFSFVTLQRSRSIPLCYLECSIPVRAPDIGSNMADDVSDVVWHRGIFPTGGVGGGTIEIP